MIENTGRKYIETFPKRVDITDVLDIVDHPVFQRLREKSQLGLVKMIRPGGVHTRFDHSIGVYNRCTPILTRLNLKNPSEFNNETITALKVAGLLHDIGHSPYSHQTEPLLCQWTDKNHNDETMNIIRRVFKDILLAKGIDYNLVVSVFDGKEPKHVIIDDKTLGADKLDYLERDSYYMHFSGSPDIQKIMDHLIYIDGKLGVEEKAINEVIACQEHYYKLHNEAYLSKPSLINQRMLQRAIQESESMKDFDSLKLWGLTDSQLEAILDNSKSETAKSLYEKLKQGTAHLLKSAVVFKIKGYEHVEITGNKPINVLGISEEDVSAFVQKYKNPLELKRLEDKLSKKFGLREGEIIIAALSYYGRLAPSDVNIFSERKGFYSLFDSYGEHKDNLNRLYKASFAIRIATLPKERNFIYENAQSVEEIIMEDIKNNCQKS